MKPHYKTPTSRHSATLCFFTMKRLTRTANKLLLALGTIGVLAATGKAGVVRVGHYGLGEAGTVTGTTSPYTPLIDDAGTPNNFTGGQFGGTATATIGSFGVSAPGSTAYLQKPGGDYGWFGTNFNSTDDWAVQLWIRADSNLGTIQFESDNSAAGVSIWFQGEDGNGTDIAFAHGLGGTASATSGNLFDYSVGSFYKIGIVRYNGVNNYYIGGGSPLASDTQAGMLGNMLIGFAAGGTSGGAGGYDELNVWTFDHTADSLASVQAAMALPEPSSAVALAGGLLLLGLRRRRARA